MATEFLNIPLAPGRRIYFASDIHFGEPDYATSRDREDRLLRWIDAVRHDAEALFFVGDVFDFWFEYKRAVPAGFVRFQGCIAELTDAGLPVFFFPGNHDLWIGDYLEHELGIHIVRDRLVIESNGKRIYVAHGDGLGPGDHKFKLLKKVFTNRFCQWLFRWLHPDIGIKLARAWSHRSRLNHDDSKFKGPDGEWLLAFARRQLESQHYDYFIFGHRHLPLELPVGDRSKYLNLGDWISHFTYGEFDGDTMHLRTFQDGHRGS